MIDLQSLHPSESGDIARDQQSAIPFVFSEHRFCVSHFCPDIHVWVAAQSRFACSISGDERRVGKGGSEQWRFILCINVLDSVAAC